MLGDVSEEDVDGGGVIRLIIRVAIRIEPWQSRGGGRKKAEIAGRTRTDHATLAFFKRATILRPFVEKIPPQLFFLSMLTNARLDTGGRKKRKLKAVPILGLVSITPPLVSWIAGRGGCSKYSVLNVLGEGD